MRKRLGIAFALSGIFHREQTREKTFIRVRRAVVPIRVRGGVVAIERKDTVIDTVVDIPAR